MLGQPITILKTFKKLVSTIPLTTDRLHCDKDLDAQIGCMDQMSQEYPDLGLYLEWCIFI